MARRAAPSLVIAVLLTAGAVFVLGPPDFAAAAAFFSASLPTLDQGEAVVSVLSWMLIAAVVIIAAADARRRLHTASVAPRRVRPPALIALAGLLLLTIAIVHRAAPAAPRLCCGATSAAIDQAVRLAR